MQSPSYVTLTRPESPQSTILDFLAARFPRMDREIWQQRLENGKITDETGAVVTIATPYREGLRLRYFREVENEAPIPFDEHIVFENEHMLVADKPHFLPVTPSGSYVNECLLNRLRRKTNNPDLVPVHRLDRETAGIVLFSKQKVSRNALSGLFRHGEAKKEYEAIGSLPDDRTQNEWLVESRIERSEQWIVFHNVPGEINARSRIRLLEVRGDKGRYELEPFTGKTHQLRLHMSLIGAQILNDPFYPVLQPEPSTPDYSAPLQLLAKRLSFTDPLSDKSMQFESSFRLKWQA